VRRHQRDSHDALRNPRAAINVKTTGLTPTLWTEDIPATISFYRDLGFQCTAHMAEWASLERDGVEVMVSAPNRHEPYDRPQFTGSFYFRVEDVDGWWKRLKDKAAVVYPVENFDYGMREFAIRDNNGYILQFGSEVG